MLFLSHFSMPERSQHCMQAPSQALVVPWSHLSMKVPYLKAPPNALSSPTSILSALAEAPPNAFLAPLFIMPEGSQYHICMTPSQVLVVPWSHLSHKVPYLRHHIIFTTIYYVQPLS